MNWRCWLEQTNFMVAAMNDKRKNGLKWYFIVGRDEARQSSKISRPKISLLPTTRKKDSTFCVCESHTMGKSPPNTNIVMLRQLERNSSKKNWDLNSLTVFVVDKKKSERTNKLDLSEDITFIHSYADDVICVFFHLLFRLLCRSFSTLCPFCPRHLSSFSSRFYVLSLSSSLLSLVFLHGVRIQRKICRISKIKHRAERRRTEEGKISPQWWSEYKCSCYEWERKVTESNFSCSLKWRKNSSFFYSHILNSHYIMLCHFTPLSSRHLIDLDHTKLSNFLN